MTSTETFRRTSAEINLDHLLHNWNAIQNIAGDDRFICPMIKANAYGHGAPEVAQALDREGAKSFGVCLIEEGLRLRAAGIKSEILVFSGFDKQGAEKILEYQMVPVVSSWQQIKALEAAADEPVKVHLKFDTGMNRLGFFADDCEKLVDYFKKSKLLKLKAVLSHLAVSEDCIDPAGMSIQQLKRLSEVHHFFGTEKVFAHVLNSGGILSLRSLNSHPVKGTESVVQPHWGFRPGILLYGYKPTGPFGDLEIKPVMNFRSVVNNMRVVAPGESVSYGATWRASRKSHIAVVPVGYADGVHRALSNRGSVLIGGMRLPIVGVVCMDFLMVDVTELVESSGRADWTDESVTIFGYDENGLLESADSTANELRTISWEILTSVSHRVPRHFKGLKKS